MNILNYLPLYSQIGLRVLIDKSLIKLHYQQLWMCNLVQERARDRVCQESLIAGKRTSMMLYLNNMRKYFIIFVALRKAF